MRQMNRKYQKNNYNRHNFEIFNVKKIIKNIKYENFLGGDRNGI